MTERATDRPSEGCSSVNVSHAWLTLLSVTDCPLCLTCFAKLSVLSPLLGYTPTGRAVHHVHREDGSRPPDVSFVVRGNVHEGVLPIRLSAAIGLMGAPEFSDSGRMRGRGSRWPHTCAVPSRSPMSYQKVKHVGA